MRQGLTPATEIRLRFHAEGTGALPSSLDRKKGGMARGVQAIRHEQTDRACFSFSPSGNERERGKCDCAVILAECVTPKKGRQPIFVI